MLFKDGQLLQLLMDSGGKEGRIWYLVKIWETVWRGDGGRQWFYCCAGIRVYHVQL